MGNLYEQLSGAQALRVEGKSAKNIAYYNAEVAEQKAKAEELRAQFDQMQQEKEAQRIRSRISADIGAAGGTGSPVALDIKMEQARELELENLLIGYEGMVRSQQLKSQATLSRLQGDLARQRGKSAARAANIQFGMQLASFGMPFLGGLGGGVTAGGANATGAGGAGFSVNPTTGMGF